MPILRWIIDTLHRFLDGDENSAQDTKTMLDACAILMGEFDCSVVGASYRCESQRHRQGGVDRLRGRVRSTLRYPSRRKQKKPIIKIIQRKNKDAELSPDKILELETVAIEGWYDEDGEQVTSAVVVESGSASCQRYGNKNNGGCVYFRYCLAIFWGRNGRKYTIYYKIGVAKSL